MTLAGNNNINRENIRGGFTFLYSQQYSVGIIVLLWLLSERVVAHESVLAVRAELEGNNSQYYNEQYPIPAAASSWMVDILAATRARTRLPAWPLATTAEY